MSLRNKKCKGGFGFLTVQNAGTVKLTILLTVAGFLIFFLLAGNVHQTKAEDCDCGSCHGENHHGDNWAGCSACHDSPPQTGTHLTHYNSAPLQSLSYSNTTNTNTDDAYKFGCGNCHPLDNTKHRDGILQIELYNANAPADSLKFKNPSSAEYTAGLNITSYSGKLEGQPAFSYSDGTCTNVYCHSGYTITSGPVGNPLTYPANPIPPGYKVNEGYIMDETCSNLTYAPYTVNYQRVYTTTPPWGSQWSTKSLQFKSQTVNFTVGRVVRGAISFATGTILSQKDGGSIGLITLSGVNGNFIRDEIITEVGGTGSAKVDGRIEIRYRDQTTDFVIGNVVTGQTSGAKGTIFADSDAGTTGGLALSGVTGTFINGETITGATGGAAAMDSADSGATLSHVCTQCHQFPLLTDSTAVSAGVGDTHMWKNEYGYIYGHANNMEYFPGIPCRTCHYDTVSAMGKSFRVYPVEIYDPVPLQSRVMHVNGLADVKLDTVNGYRYYYSSPYYGTFNTQVSLTEGSYDPATQTCTNVACHYGAPLGNFQYKAVWGSPFRGWEGPQQECDLCHRMGYLSETCQ